MENKKNIFLNKKVTKVTEKLKIFTILFILTILIITPLSTINAHAENLIASIDYFEDVEIPKSFIEGKHYFIIRYGSGTSETVECITSDFPLHLIKGDNKTMNPNGYNTLSNGLYYISTNPDEYEFKAKKYKYNLTSGTWSLTTDVLIYYNSNSVMTEFNLNGKYLTNNDIPVMSALSTNEITLFKNHSIEEENNSSNGDTIIIDGEEISVKLAMVQTLIKIEFILKLLLVVTVVFFIINKFWSWCRRLFTTSIR